MSNKIVKAKSHAENVAAQQSAAVKASIQKANDCYDSMYKRGTDMETAAVGLLNDAKDMGVAIQEATGREQLEFLTFKNLEPYLNPGIHLKLAQSAVSLATRYGIKHKFKTMAEVRNEITPFLFELKIIEATKRALQLSTGGEENPFLWIATEIRAFSAEYKKKLESKPMATWPDETLDTFIYQTETIHDDNEAAKKIRDERSAQAKN